MNNQSFKKIKSLLASDNIDDLRQGLDMAKKEISITGKVDAMPLLEVLSSVFYIDPLEKPELVPIIDEAITLVAGFGNWVTPILIENLAKSDLKAQMAIANALGRLGAEAINPLINQINNSTDDDQKMVMLYALSKIKSPQLIAAAQIALDNVLSPHRELRDTATRALGKFVESIPPADFNDELKQAFIEKLTNNLADADPGIRAKAIRSYGKLAKFNHLNENESKRLRLTLDRILGYDEDHEWDRAYIVRKEAEQILNYL